MKKLLYLLSLTSLCILILACGNNTVTQENKESNNLGETYQEQHRLQFHFSPPEKWMNDPNGMVYYEGEYHLFYQYYPEDIVWGPMHWGHAVSKDLVSWENLPIALYPDSLGYIFSGSAVVDWNNTSGFGQDGQPPLIAIFTYHDPVGEKAGKIDFQYQGIAYSNDKGRTWTKYEGNPVVPNPGIRDFRDPKVIWDEGSNQWIMVFAAWDHVKFYGSPNLKDWEHLSDFGREWGTHAGVWECPDLFPMQIDGTDETKWVLLVSINPGSYNGGSGTQYFVGNFDGKNFTLDPAFAKDFGTEPAFVPEGTVFEDFEGKTYKGWTAEGEAFGIGPARGALEGQQEVAGFTGNGLVNSFLNGDQAIGKLTSDPFTISSSFINFQVGGGNDQKRTYLALLVDGKEVRKSAGSNGENLFWDGWDVTEFKGKEAQIQLVDTHPGGWGHINVDQITFAEEKAKPSLEKAIWLEYGRDNYAGVTWSDVPKEDGRRIFMGWMSNWSYAQVVPTKNWRSAMTVARELVLNQTEVGLRVLSKPVKELEKRRGQQAKLEAQETSSSINLSEKLGITTSLQELIVEIDLAQSDAGDFGLAFSNSKGETYQVGYDVTNNQFYSDRRQSGKVDFSPAFASKVHIAPRLSSANTLRMHVLVDVGSVELFADGGSTVLTDLFFPNEDYSQFDFYVEGGRVMMKRMEGYRLKGVW